MSIDTAFPAVKIPSKLISPGCYFFFFLEAGIAAVVAQPDFYYMCGQRSFWISLIFLIKKNKRQTRWDVQINMVKVYIYTHTHKTHMPSFFKVTSRVTFIFCTCVEFMTINIVFEERRQCKAPAFYKNHQRLESVPIDMHAIPTTVKIFFRYF